MPGLAFEFYFATRLSRNRSHNTNRKILLFQNRPLLNMHLGITNEIIRIEFARRKFCRITAKLLDRITKRYAVRIDSLQIFTIEGPGNCAASEIGALKSNAFFIREPKHANIEPKILTFKFLD